MGKMLQKSESSVEESKRTSNLSLRPLSYLSNFLNSLIPYMSKMDL